MKKGEGCEHLYFLRVNEGKRQHRCCELRDGLWLKDWRCVGQESKECPIKKGNDLSLSEPEVLPEDLSPEAKEKLHKLADECRNSPDGIIYPNGTPVVDFEEGNMTSLGDKNDTAKKSPERGD